MDNTPRREAHTRALSARLLSRLFATSIRKTTRHQTSARVFAQLFLSEYKSRFLSRRPKPNSAHNMYSKAGHPWRHSLEIFWIRSWIITCTRILQLQMPWRSALSKVSGNVKNSPAYANSLMSALKKPISTTRSFVTAVSTSMKKRPTRVGKSLTRSSLNPRYSSPKAIRPAVA